MKKYKIEFQTKDQHFTPSNIEIFADYFEVNANGDLLFKKIGDFDVMKTPSDRFINTHCFASGVWGKVKIIE